MVGGGRLHPSGSCFDNAPHKEYKHIGVCPIASAMGAEIIGVDLKNLTQEQFLEVEEALFRHKVIFFRKQKLSHADHEAFSQRLGDFAEDAYTSGVDGHKNVHPLIKEADDKSEIIFGSGWHTDSPFLERPPAITILRSIQIPPYGGDTIFCNSALAYQTLSPTYREMIRNLKVRFSMRDIFGAAAASKMEGAKDTPIGKLAKLAASTPESELPESIKVKIRGNGHPMVRTHPVSGEKALYVDQDYAIGIDGMSEDESDPILSFLRDHITQPAFSCRIRWEPDMLVLWDNRLCIHQAFNDYQGYRREMYRTTVAGEKPA